MNFDSPSGYLWPSIPWFLGSAGSQNVATVTTLNAASLRCAYIGKAFIFGRPAASKTLSTGSIGFRTGTTTFADTSTNLDIGIQGVSTSAGPAAQPDGTFTVKKSCVPGTTAINSAAWNTISMGTGSASITHGDLIAVVFDMTARAGSDSVILQALASFATGTFPVTNIFSGGAWAATGSAFIPNVVITFDDGTLGTIDGGMPISTNTNEGFADATNPDERGRIFQVPRACSIDALWAWVQVADATATFDLKLYSSPTSGVASVGSTTVDPHVVGVAAVQRLIVQELATELQLFPNVDYCIAVKATGSGTVSLPLATLSDQAYFQLWAGGDKNALPSGQRALAKTTRNNSSGDFATGTTTASYLMGVRISNFLATSSDVGHAG